MVCQTLNDALEARSFTHAASLRPEQFRLDTSAEAQLELGLAVLHEAMMDAILDFESKASNVSDPLSWQAEQSSELAVLYI
ncbi:MAG: hypothetical protein JXQ73_31805 [Phycisphaerae bacterium]|nr:hypothetical protein [Phycisphaerae bacterium]